MDARSGTPAHRPLAAADARIRTIDARLAEAFPDFASLQKQTPSDFAAVKAGLGDDDVMLFFADTSRRDRAGFETYLWAIPKQGDVRWLKLARSTTDLSADVRRLRGLMGVGGQARARGRCRPMPAPTAPVRSSPPRPPSMPLHSVLSPT